MQLGTQRTQSNFLPWPHMAPAPFFKNALIILRVVTLKTYPISLDIAYGCVSNFEVPKSIGFLHVSMFPHSSFPGDFERKKWFWDIPHTLWKMNGRNSKFEVWKMTFLFNWVSLRFHVDFQGRNLFKDKIQTVPLGHEMFLLLQEVTQARGKWNSIQNLCYTGPTSVFEPNCKCNINKTCPILISLYIILCSIAGLYHVIVPSVGFCTVLPMQEGCKYNPSFHQYVSFCDSFDRWWVWDCDSKDLKLQQTC